MAARLGFVSTYPPTRCGLATFTDSLRGALVGSSADDSVVVRLLDKPEAGPGTHLVAGDRAGIAPGAAQLNQCEAVIVQHEFGVYGGQDGADVLLLLDELRVPVVVVLHTVLVTPTPHQRNVLESVVAAADAVVVMTATARDRLTRYAVDMRKVDVIPHGAPPSSGLLKDRNTGAGRSRATVLTWGLLGPGKGIEWGIEAMAELADIVPPVHYVIAGRTHPKVFAHEGEAYRDRLTEQIWRLGLQRMVTLDPQYRDAASLAGLVADADVVLLPYDSVDQVTSGVLIEAVAAGKPVVATRFPHAVELLANGMGTVVPHRDPHAIAEALRTIITRRDVAAEMAAKAGQATEHLLWPAVAEQFRALLGRLTTACVVA
ncbi:glycosyltransferase [uncultured Jatrophihabitans sp.]|uniref:glycosyltransferase n=1 Tax=uncultured Jatrophihabitans sp. TaxID=1610747 RepID=UPI0035CB5758